MIAKIMKLNWFNIDVIYQGYPRDLKDSYGDGMGDKNSMTSRLDYLKSLGVDIIWNSSNFKSSTTGVVKVFTSFSEIISKFDTPVSYFTSDNTLQQDQTSTYDFVSNHSLLNYHGIEVSKYHLEIDVTLREKPKSVSTSSRKLSFEHFFHFSNYNVIEKNLQKMFNFEEDYYRTKPQWKDTRNTILSYATSLLNISPDYFFRNLKRQTENLNYVLFTFQTILEPKEDNENFSCIESKNFKKNDKKVYVYKKYTENNFIIVLLSFHKYEIDVEYDFDNYDCLTLLLNNYQDVLKTSNGILLKPYQSLIFTNN